MEYNDNISQIWIVGVAIEGLMGINIPRKKLFFNEDAADRAVGVGGPLPPPRFWQIKLTFLNQGLQIMPTTLLIASPGFLDLPKGLA